MPQPALPPETIERAKELRKQGQSIAAIASELGISQGSAWNATTGIKPARKSRSESQKEAPKPHREAKDIMDRTTEARLDPETIDLANRVRKARLQAELDEIDNRRQQRQEVEDLRVKERKLMLLLDESRLGAAKGDSGIVTEITQLRSELAELREARHQAELRQLQYQHEVEMTQLGRQIASINRTGMTSFDIMSQAMGKAENLAILLTGKVDKFIAGSQADQQLTRALRLGISPEEFEALKRGPESIPTREEWAMIQRAGARQRGEPYTEPEEGEYEGIVAMYQARNRRYEEVSGRVSMKLGQSKEAIVRTAQSAKTGKAPEPGEPEPTILQAESRLVKCTRCSTSFDVDLAEAKRHAGPDKRLYVHCANPKCQFLLDITGLLPPPPKPPGAPECYMAGEGGVCANPEKGSSETYQCRDCQWAGDLASNLVSMFYE